MPQKVPKSLSFSRHSIRLQEKYMVTQVTVIRKEKRRRVQRKRLISHLFIRKTGGWPFRCIAVKLTQPKLPIRIVVTI